MKYIILCLWTLVIFCGTIVAQPSIAYYVSPAGNDTNAGTQEAPFRTFERAVSQVEITKSQDPSMRVTVYFREGAYPISRTVHLTARGSGSAEAPVAYVAYPGEFPVFHGSIELTKWKRLEDKKLLERLKPSVRNRIFITDLKRSDIADFGDPIQVGNRPDLSYNNEWQILARWPNQGFAYAGKALGKILIPKALNGNSGAKEGIFTYLNANVNRWKDEPDGKLGGYWFWDWNNSYQTIQKIDTVAKTIELKDSCGYRHGLRYFGLNLFCELDTAGEWYLDRKRKQLYWYPPAGVNPAEKVEVVSLSVLNAPFMVSMENCSYVILDGLSFVETRGSGISVKGGSSCFIRNCRLERIGKDGIRMEEGTGHEIDGCFLSHLGNAGIYMKGGNRKTLTPANFVLKQTVVEYFSLFRRTYCPAISADGCGIYIVNNRFSHASSSAMSLAGNDMIAEYNQIDHVVTESDDQGGFDLYLNPSFRGIILRYNRWSDIHGGTHYGAAGIRLDDMISGVQIYGNVFERCGSHEFGAIQIHGGDENRIEDNLFYQCNMAVSFTPYKEEDWHKSFTKLGKILYEEVNINSPLYQTKYPELRNLGKNINVNSIRNNLLVDCDSVFFRDNDMQIIANNPEISSQGNSAEYYCKATFLQPYGIKAIPIEKIGVLTNRWVNK
ncbi:right-handed parallel beta-helix repeat-containing protein [Parabacteroides pacaensis]|uniref:right-handed parallel beta-helix repeat-containing protein n=1 Tax=Parabacteroides pacaensis TaxID=2086575 RepID=UPI00131AFD83|nr:right-handed parallel beta-helix repeat-containing protein [Parabacteroides pacaensis]